MQLQDKPEDKDSGGGLSTYQVVAPHAMHKATVKWENGVGHITRVIKNPETKRCQSTL